MANGGKRPGAGRKKGVPQGKKKTTLSKEAAREAVRLVVMERYREMLDSQIANAIGLKYLVVRQKSTGKFLKVAEAEAALLDPETEIIEMWDKVPCVQAFTDLMNRALDKPSEAVAVAHSGKIEISWKK